MNTRDREIGSARRQRALAAMDLVAIEAALIDSFATCDPPVIVSAEQMTLEDLGDDKVQATIVQAEGGPAAEDITAAAEQLAFLTRMAEQLGVANVGFDAPPVTVTVVVAPPPPSASPSPPPPSASPLPPPASAPSPPPPSFTPLIDVDPGRSDEHTSENAGDDGPVLELWADRWLLSLWERPLQCCAWGAVAFGGDGGALVPSAIAATRCKRPSVESCRDWGK